MDTETYNNFSQGIKDTLLGVYKPQPRFVGYAEGHDYATSERFGRSRPTEDAYAFYFPTNN